jgi:hypothetical protein
VPARARELNGRRRARPHKAENEKPRENNTATATARKILKTGCCFTRKRASGRTRAYTQDAQQFFVTNFLSVG